MSSSKCGKECLAAGIDEEGCFIEPSPLFSQGREQEFIDKCAIALMNGIVSSGKKLIEEQEINFSFDLAYAMADERRKRMGEGN